MSQPSGPSDTYKTSDISSAQMTKGNTRRRALSPSEHVDIVTALLSSSEDDSRGSYSTTQSGNVAISMKYDIIQNLHILMHVHTVKPNLI